MGDAGVFLNSVADGASFGLTNRIDAGRAALQTMAENAARDYYHLPHRFSPAQAYRAVKDKDDAESAQFAQNHPVLNFAGNMAGSMINPAAAVGGNWASKAPTLLGMMGRGAAVGAGLGAANGAGNAKEGQEPAGALNGGFGGMLVGGAAPAIGQKVLPAVLRMAGRGLNNLGGAVTRALNTDKPLYFLDPADQAMQAVGRVLADKGVGPQELTNSLKSLERTLPPRLPGSSQAFSPSLFDVVKNAGNKAKPAVQLFKSAARDQSTAAADYASQAGNDIWPHMQGAVDRLPPGQPASDLLKQVETARVSGMADPAYLDKLKEAADYARGNLVNEERPRDFERRISDIRDAGQAWQGTNAPLGTVDDAMRAGGRDALNEMLWNNYDETSTQPWKPGFGMARTLRDKLNLLYGDQGAATADDVDTLSNHVTWANELANPGPASPDRDWLGKLVKDPMAQTVMQVAGGYNPEEQQALIAKATAPATPDMIQSLPFPSVAPPPKAARIGASAAAGASGLFDPQHLGQYAQQLAALPSLTQPQGGMPPPGPPRVSKASFNLY
jgi:hypothetical protein